MEISESIAEVENLQQPNFQFGVSAPHSPVRPSSTYRRRLSADMKSATPSVRVHSEYGQRYQVEKMSQIEKLKNSPLLVPVAFGSKTVQTQAERQQQNFRAHVGNTAYPGESDSILDSQDGRATMDMSKESEGLQRLLEQGKKLAGVIKKARLHT